MKVKHFFKPLLMFFAAGLVTFNFMACSEDTVVSGDMIYKSGFAITNMSSTISSGSHVALLESLLQNNITQLQTKYAKEWTVPYQGASLDEALAGEDQKALADFDVAVSDMQLLSQQFSDMLYDRDYAGGSFSYTYSYSVSRDKMLRESEPFVFEYSSSKLNRYEVKRAFSISLGNPEDYDKELSIDLTEALKTTGLNNMTIALFDPNNLNWEDSNPAFAVATLNNVTNTFYVGMVIDGQLDKDLPQGLWYYWISGTTVDQKPGAIKVSFNITK